MPGRNSKEREAVKAAYPSPKWAAKVNGMDDGQVIAVFMRLRAQNKI